MTDAGWKAEPFFLPVGRGQRFCLFHPAAGSCRGTVLYVHPFAEELNRSRRMAALQARALAALGYGVLQIDLHGCGDSSGDFADARWELWKEDLAAASLWLDRRLGNLPLVLWGLRLGALLALDYARDAARAPGAAILWQPVTAGQAFLNHFLRLRVANDMLAGGSPKAGTTALRAALARGETLEVAGYELHPQLARAIEAIDLTTAAPGPVARHWFDVAAAPGRSLAPVAAGVVERWRSMGVPVQVHQVVGQPFWSTQEIAECPALLSATSRIIGELRHAV